MSYNIPITKVEKSRLTENIDLTFGRTFTDHMLVADYNNGKWENVKIVPFEAIPFNPSLMALHYGQSIFEGIKAYVNNNGEVIIFRPDRNFKRFNESADRMEMPQLPAEIFLEGMKQLIAVDKDWIPKKENHSLYIRPFMFATDQYLGVRPSHTYKFIIILSPSGPYFAQPAKILVEDEYTRAAPGGTGRAKNAGNYGGSLRAAANAQKRGFDQVLWTDPFEHKWLQEVGAMNVMFVLKDNVITPSLNEGTVLEGVTRDSAITVLKNDMGKKVEERRINIDELVEAYKNRDLLEAFGTGTAAVISPIQQLTYKGFDMKFDTENMPVAQEIAQRLLDIRMGVTEDKYGWIVKV